MDNPASSQAPGNAYHPELLNTIRQLTGAPDVTAVLAALLGTTPDPIIILDRDQRVRLLNPPAEALLETTCDVAVGRPAREVVPDNALHDLLRVDESSQEAASAQIAGGDGFVYSPRVVAIRGEDGALEGWALVLRDITRFEQLNRNMADFLSTVSHDMRSPLTFIKGYLDMLGLIGPLTERQEAFIEKITGGVMQMADMIEKILDAGRLDPHTGRYELSREPADIGELAQRAMQALAEPARKKGLALSAAIADDLPILNVDSARLASAFSNLIENAVKYTPEGGAVQVSLEIEQDNLVFRVQDNGYGIAAADQARLFQRNVRLHRQEWKQVKGSGLGLFIVKNVAQRHGGDAWVESVEGQGSTFALAIPLNGPNLLADDG
ncbi:MAG: PAS domain-containing protein [Chloroflexi bacterium]|nr:PAS domain-containing protein [Chloroflexota bacterium]